MRRWPRKILRIGIRVLLGLVVLVLLAAGGIFAWLHTESGERAALALTTDILARQGIVLTADRLAVLPSRVQGRNVRLADSQGEWLIIREIDVHLRLRGLLDKTISISDGTAVGAEMLRIPRTASSGEETQAEKESTPGYFSLPIGLDLQNVDIRDGVVHAPVLFPSDESASGPALTVAVTGSATARPEGELVVDALLQTGAADPLMARWLGGPLVTNLTTAATVKGSVGRTIQAVILGNAQGELRGRDVSLDYSFDGSLEEKTLCVRELLLASSGARLAADGSFSFDTVSGQANLTVQTENGGQWQAILRDVTGQAMDGEFAMTAAVSLAESGRFLADVNLAGASVTWPVPELQQALGPVVAIKASLGGGQGTPYTLQLRELRSGVLTASGNAAFSTASNSIEATLNAAVSDTGALLPQIRGAVRLTATASGNIESPNLSLDARSDRLGLDQGEFAGIRLTAATTGNLTSPVFSVGATANRLRLDHGDFGDVRFSAGGKLLMGSSLSVDGTAALNVAASPAGPAGLRTSLTLRREGGGTLTARLFDVDLQLAGTALAADVTAVVPPGGGLPGLDGTLSARVTDWRSLAALTGVSLEGGNARLEATLRNAGGQSASATLRAARLEMKDVFAFRRLNATLEASNPASPDLTFEAFIGPGSASQYVWQSGAVRVQATDGTGVFGAVLRGDTAARSDLQALGSAKSGVSRPSRREILTLAGKFSVPSSTVTFTRLAARFPDSTVGVHLAKPSTISLENGIMVEDLTLMATPGRGTLELDARFTARESVLQAQVRDFSFRLIRDLADVPVPDGTANLTATLNKTGPTVSGSLIARADLRPASGTGGTAGADADGIHVFLTGNLDQQPDAHFPELTASGGVFRLHGESWLTTLPVGTDLENAAMPDDAAMRLAYNLPLRFSASGIPDLDRGAPLAATLAWRGEIAQLWGVLPIPDKTLEGLAQIDGNLGGSLTQPDYAVKAYVAGGKFEDNVYGYMVRDIALQAETASSGRTMLVARATDGASGTVAIEGTITPPAEGQTGPRLSARGHINHLSPVHRDDLAVQFSGRLSAEGDLASPSVVAAVEIERAELSLLTKFGGGVRTLPITDPDAEVVPRAPGPTLDVTISVPSKFYIRGRGLDSEWEGQLAVKGPVASPVLTGELRPVRGYFDLLTKPFEFTQGDIEFFGGDRINPGLDLTLSYSGPSITAMVYARGTASRPSITMESRPPLPQDQIVSRVLFGKNFSELSRFEALQVANSIRELANIGEGGLDILSTMRTRLGFDMLRIGSTGSGTDDRSVSGAPGASEITGPQASGDSDDTSTPTLEAGKYINDAIYVGVEQGTNGDTGVRVEIELRPNLNLTGKTTSQSSQVGIGWKKDY